MNLSAQKAKNIQMLKLSDHTSHLELQVVQACMNGRDSVMIPTDRITEEQLEVMDKELGYNLKWHHDIKEWEISWARR